MSRPPAHEWQVLGEDSDPVPGDPEEVAKLGRELRATADAIRKQADEIKALASVDAWKGKAADAFRDEADDASSQLSKAFHRYDVAARALGTRVPVGPPSGESKEYAAELLRAQRLADAALSDAQHAEGERHTNQTAIDKQPKDTPKDDPDLKKLHAKTAAAEGAISQAKKDLAHAKSVRDTAAKAAASAIRDAIAHDGLKDGRWDKFKNWVHENAGWITKIADIAGWVATVCGVLALAVGWIPIIGQALAAVLGTIAIIATVVSLAAHLVLALGGEGSWFDVALDVVGLATFGIGRGAIAGARGASAGVKTMTRSSVFRREMAEVAERGLKKGSPAYKKALQNAWKVANREAPGAARGKQAAAAAKNAPRGLFPGWGRVGQAFNPASIAKDSVESIKGLKAFRDVGQLGRSSTWQGVKFSLKDPDLVHAGQELGRLGNATNEGLAAVRHGFNSQSWLWGGATGAGTLIDGIDKAGGWEATGVKDATTGNN